MRPRIQHLNPQTPEPAELTSTTIMPFALFSDDQPRTPATWDFFDFPAEVRNMIYFYIESLVPVLLLDFGSGLRHFDGGETTFLGSSYRGWRIAAFYDPEKKRVLASRPLFEFPRQPSITRVCRQIRGETLPIFYGANQFVIRDMYFPGYHGLHAPFPAVLWEWLRSIRPHIRLMRSVAVQRGGPPCAQTDHETIAALTDSDFDFREGVLRELPQRLRYPGDE